MQVKLKNKLVTKKQDELCGIASYLFADEIDHGSRINIAYELNPVFGKSNPIAPDFNIWIDGEKRLEKLIWAGNMRALLIVFKVVL